MRKFGYILGGLVLLVLVILGVAVIFLATIDPNDYKEDIKEIVRNETGRTLNIQGPIKLSYYPVLGFSATRVSLSNPPGFQADEPFASVEQLQAGVRIWPLLTGSIEIGTIRLAKPVVTVIQTRDRQTNLAFSAPKPDPKKPVQQADEDDEVTMTADEIIISGGTLIYRDLATNQTHTLKEINFTMSDFSFDNTVSVEIAAVYEGPSMSSDFQGQSSVLLTRDFSSFTLENLTLDTGISNDQTGPVTIKTTAGMLKANLQGKTITLEEGRIEWEDTNLLLAGGYDWKATTPALNVSFSLDSETLDGDKILALAGAQQPAPDIEPAKLPAQTQQGGQTEMEIPVRFLAKATIEGTVDIGTLYAADMSLSDIEAEIKTQEGKIVTRPLRFNLYGGRFKGAQILEPSGNTLNVQEEGAFEDVRLGRALNDLYGRQLIEASGNLEYDLQTSGRTLQALGNNLGGTVSVDIGEGIITYGQITKRINQARILLSQQEVIDDVSESLNFTSLKAKFEGKSGMFQNDDLVLLAPPVHALGMGQINLAQNLADYTLRVGMGIEADDFEQADHIPVRISGPFTNLSYELDIQSLIEEQAGQEIEQKGEELLGKALEDLGIEPSAGNEQKTGQTQDQKKEEAPLDMLKGLLGEQ